jgi:hypothetical protein
MLRELIALTEKARGHAVAGPVTKHNGVARATGAEVRVAA